MKRVFCICLGAAAVLTGCPDDKPGAIGNPIDAGPDVVVISENEGGEPDAGLEWREALGGLDGALLSMWGPSATDLWAVGGPLGNAGFDSLVVRYDGASWKRVSPGKTDSFWWVHGTSATDVWLVGEKGRITHWDGNAFTEMTSGTDATLFGVWAAAPDDVWAVGGTPDSTTGTNTVVLHWDGKTWSPDATLVEPLRVAFFKVWGSSKDDIYVVGEAGVIWHRVQGTWKKEGAGLATGRLTTVAGCNANEVYAVGGRDLLVSDGTTWKRADNIDPLLILNDLNGVSCGPNGVVIVGNGSLKLRLMKPPGIDPTKRWETDFGSEPLVDLHGAWADPTGVFWGVGGQFAAAAHPNVKRGGTVARWSTTPVVSPVLSP
jgi:hypothetical protein